MKCAQNRICLILLTAVFALITVIINFPDTAYSANRDYLSEAKWIDNPNVSQVEYSKNAMSDTFALKGSVKYYFDSSSNVFYVRFVFNESSITPDEDAVSVCYDISNQNEAYHLSVSKDGYSCDDDPDKDYFTAQYDFQNNGSNQQICVVALEIKNSSNTNYADVYLNINGHNYKSILNQIELISSKSVRTAKTNTTKASSTKSRASTANTNITASKTSRQYSTKFSGGIVSQTTKMQSRQTTATQGNVQAKTAAQTKQGSDNSSAEYVLSAEEDYSDKDGGTISKDAKIMIIAACVTAAVGAFFIISGMLKKDKQSTKSADENDDKDDDNDEE